MLFIGIDPGVSGALAFLGEDGRVIAVHKMPDTERDILETLRLHTDPPRAPKVEQVRAVLERVHSSPQMGVSSAFTFGKGYGGLRMALIALEIPFDEPTPQAWQKALQFRTGGDKHVSKARAQELFSFKVNNWNADALLLAEYCRRVQLGMTPPPPPVGLPAPRTAHRLKTMTAKGDVF